MRSIPLSRFTFDPAHDCDKETNELPSKTTPEQTLSLRQLLSRFSRGQSVPTFEPVFDDDPDMPDITKLDPMQKEELRFALNNEITFLRSEAAKRKQANDLADEVEKQTKESKAPDDAIVVPPSSPSPPVD